MVIVIRPAPNVYVPLPLQNIITVGIFVFLYEAYGSSCLKTKHYIQNGIHVYTYLVIKKSIRSVVMILLRSDVEEFQHSLQIL